MSLLSGQLEEREEEVAGLQAEQRSLLTSQAADRAALEQQAAAATELEHERDGARARLAVCTAQLERAELGTDTEHQKLSKNVQNKYVDVRT